MWERPARNYQIDLLSLPASTWYHSMKIFTVLIVTATVIIVIAALVILVIHGFVAAGVAAFGIDLVVVPAGVSAVGDESENIHNYI